MSLARSIRRAIPLRWQPVARYHYERWRGLAEREMEIVCGAVRRGDRVADVGASVGVYAYAFARRGAMVEAFEPQAECIPVLRALAAARPAIRVHPVALGAAAGAAELVPAGEGRGPETRIRIAPDAGDAGGVRVVRLDDLDLPPITLLKVDVEGGEVAVFEGARRTIARDRPLAFVEIEQRHLARPILEVFAWFESLGYAIEYLDAAGDPHPVRDFELGRDQDVSAIGAPGRTYVNNFFLSHRNGSRRWFG